MNLLVDLLQEGELDRDAGERLGLEELADLIHLELPDPVSEEGAEAYENAGIQYVGAESWSLDEFDLLPDTYEPVRWSAAVSLPLRGGIVTAFVPDDSGVETGVSLFTRIANLSGRLRAHLPGGLGTPVVDVSFEAGLHCADVACVEHADCPQCCESCRCRYRDNGLTTMLVCGCMRHL